MWTGQDICDDFVMISVVINTTTNESTTAESRLSQVALPDWLLQQLILQKKNELTCTAHQTPADAGSERGRMQVAAISHENLLPYPNCSAAGTC
jgi:hypothetical protein